MHPILLNWPQKFPTFGGRFHKLFWRPICTLRPTFEKLFTGIEPALRHAPNFNRAISILRRAPNFYEIDPGMRTTAGTWSYKMHEISKKMCCVFRPVNRCRSPTDVLKGGLNRTVIQNKKCSSQKYLSETGLVYIVLNYIKCIAIKKKCWKCWPC